MHHLVHHQISTNHLSPQLTRGNLQENPREIGASHHAADHLEHAKAVSLLQGSGCVRVQVYIRMNVCVYIYICMYV